MLLHNSIRDGASELYGIDSDERGLNLLKAHGFESLFTADLEALEKCEIDRKFDVVVAGEIIEHLNNPGLFLSGVKRFLHDDSILLVTTVNAYCAMRYLIYAFRSKDGVNEPVHPDHVAYYSVSTLSLILRRHGFKLSKILFYDVGIEHRPFNRPILNVANDIAVKFFPQLSDGLIAECTL